MSQVINSISQKYETPTPNYEDWSVEDKSAELEVELFTICNSLSKAEALTGRKGVDLAYLLSIVGSYVLGIQDGTLDPETTNPPRQLFEESLYPTLADLEVSKEAIEEDDNDESSNSATPIGYDSEESAD